MSTHLDIKPRAFGGMDTEMPVAVSGLLAPNAQSLLDDGCGGMAGSFGFAADHYEVSMRIGERALLPAVRAAPDAVIVSNGFSCREQIAQATGRTVVHIAELLQLAIRRADGRTGPTP